MYAVTLNWFRVTGKNQYARICVDYMWVVLSLHPALGELWAKYRTCSLLGNCGRDIAWDQANEFMNLDVKSAKPKDASRIDALIGMLNGVKSADLALREALGAERTEPREYTPVSATHVSAVVDILKQHLGPDTDALFGPTRHPNSPFGDGPRPWSRVRNPGNLPGNATEQQLHDEGVTWVTTQLERSPFPS
jgi:hypothetical protein